MDDPTSFYRAQSAWTHPGPWVSALSRIPPVPQQVVRSVSGLLMHPSVASLRRQSVPRAASRDRELRSVAEILSCLLARDGSPLTEARAPEKRCFCVCAGFARLATSVFRAHGVAARCRVGFASYFTPGFLEDHWVCEYHDGNAWRLLDAELDETACRDLAIDFEPWNVPRTVYLDAATAWCRLRAGQLDPARIGLSEQGLSGTWFVASNLMLDAAALNQEEMLPWERWSVGLDFGPDRAVTAECVASFDRLAESLRGAPSAQQAGRAYRENAWVRVPATVQSFLNGWPPREVPVR